MKWFNECTTVEEVKAQYKKLAKQYHPDLGGDTATMQEVNREFTVAMAKAIKGAKLSEEEAESEILSSEAYRNAIEQIIHLDGITIEVVHKWLWVTGATYPVRTTLKKSWVFLCLQKASLVFPYR